MFSSFSRGDAHLGVLDSTPVSEYGEGSRPLLSMERDPQPPGPSPLDSGLRRNDGYAKVSVRDRAFRLLDMVRMKRCQWDARSELVCINLGESAAPGAKSFSKNAPFAPFAPCSKLGRIRSSFGRQGAFGKSFPPCFGPSRPLCPVRVR